MQRRWNVFQFLITKLMTICKLCLKKSSTRTKFINYLQGFHIIAISKNTSKYEISRSKEDTSRGSTSANLDAVSEQLSKRTPQPYCLEFGKFFQN